MHEDIDHLPLLELDQEQGIFYLYVEGKKVKGISELIIEQNVEGAASGIAVVQAVLYVKTSQTKNNEPWSRD